MALIPQKTYESSSDEARTLWDEQVAAHGRMTNMKRTMAHSALTLDAYMAWYPLKDRVAEFMGERATIVFVHAISSATDCLICSTFFRRILEDWGENPDALVLSAREEQLVAFGRAIATVPGFMVAEDVVLPLRGWLNDRELVELTGLAGMMVATNMFNNVLGVELDGYLNDYKKLE